MASEILAVPEESLLDVIKVIRAGLNEVDTPDDVEYNLNKWCNEIEEYITNDDED